LDVTNFFGTWPWFRCNLHTLWSYHHVQWCRASHEWFMLEFKVYILINQSLSCVLFETLSCILLLQHVFSEVLLTFLLWLIGYNETYFGALFGMIWICCKFSKTVMLSFNQKCQQQISLPDLINFYRGF
jgi:hypothetical protein